MHTITGSKKSFHLWSIPGAALLATTAIMALALPAFAQASGPFSIGTPGTITSIDSAVDSTGATSVVYESGGAIFYVKGSAGAVETVDAPPAGVTDSHPAIAIGPDNLPQVVFAASDGQYYSKRSAGGIWSAATLVAGIPLGGFPDIAVNNTNVPQIVYAEDTDGDNYAEIHYTDLVTNNLVWDGLLDVPSGFGTFYSNPHIALDSSGTYHVIAAHESVSGTPAVHTFDIIYDTDAGIGTSFESPFRASGANLGQNPIVVAPSAGTAGAGATRVVYEQAGSAYSATLGSVWTEVVLGAFTQVSVGADNGLVVATYVTGGNINYAVDGGVGFGSGTLLAAGTNPTVSLHGLPAPGALSVYYLVGNSPTVQVTLKSVAYPTSPPVVTTQPVNQSAVYGTNATFIAAATGLPVPTVQWQVSTNAGGTWGNVTNGASVTGATTTTLTLIKPTVSMTGYQYRAVFTNTSTVNSAAATLTVTAKPISVTADIKTKVYGIIDPALTWTLTGGTALAPGDLTLVGALTRVAGENVGPYGIGVGTLQSSNPNYAITFFPANLIISAKPITVTAVTGTKPFDNTTASSGIPTVAPPLVAGDTAAFIQTYDTATVGTGKLLTPSGTITKGAPPVNVTANYTISFATVSSGVITTGTPVITWANPATVIAGTALSATQLNATANVPGGFVYTPPTGTILAGGNVVLSVTFTPTDIVNYSTATKTVTVIVTNTKITPVITWANPANIAYGTGLGATQLNATATNAAVTVPGTFTYAPPSGTILNAGVGQTLSVTFVPTDTLTFNSTSALATITVTKGTPVITWANPANIVYGTLLSSTQLNATASVPGTFIYTPAIGTKLNASATAQTLSVAFTPTDTTNYNSAIGTATVTVTKASPAVTWANPADLVTGTALSATQLNATATVPGTFVYTPASGTVLALGAAQSLSVAFTPTDAVNYNNVSTTVHVNVVLPKPTIALASSVNPAADATTLITFTATLTATQGTPTGTVTFRDGAATIGSGPIAIISGHATLTVALTGGSHSISAVYNGDTNFGANVSLSLIQTVNVPAVIGGGGGGGGGGGFGNQLIGINLSGTSPWMDGSGHALTIGIIHTPDGKVSLTIPIGTAVWNAAGAAQSYVAANQITEYPPAPSQTSLLMAFEMGPTGVTFNPAITLTMAYTDNQIPNGSRESDLYIGWWDGSKWVKLQGTVDTTANTVSAQITHFTVFALLVQQLPPTTTPPPTTTVPPTTAPPTTTVPPTTTLPPTTPITTAPIPVANAFTMLGLSTGASWLLLVGVIALTLILGMVIFQRSRTKKDD